MKYIMRSVILAILIIPVTLQPVFAGPCDDSQSSYDMATCLDRAYKAADQRLNTTYKVQRENLDAQGKTLLRNAQRAWIKFRDEECRWTEDGSRGGAMASMLGLGCQTILTERRIKDLNGAIRTQITGKNEADGLFWKSGPPLFETFDCENQLEARLALVPGYDNEAAQHTLAARIKIGNHSLDIPVGGNNENAFCSAEIAISVTDSTSACPVLRVDDGKCDAFFISWDKQKRSFRWQRN